MAAAKSRIRGGRSAERPPRQILPISVKYGVVTGLILLAFVVGVSRSLTSSSLESTTRLLQQNGLELVQLAHAFVDPYWTRTETLAEERVKEQALLEQRLQSFLREGSQTPVLDLIVTDEAGTQLIASARGGDRLKMSFDPQNLNAGAKDGIVIKEGILGGADGSIPIRSFQKKLPNNAGYVELLLSAEALAALEQKLESSTQRLVLSVLLIGIPLVMLMGFLLTRPVRLLREDMTQVARGNLDHQSSVRTTDELGALASSFNRMTRFLAEAREQEMTAQAVARDLNIASGIQNALLPRELAPISGIQIARYYQSAKEVGGDYYDVIPLDGDRAGIVVADVSGKGLAGSLVMTMTRSLVRMAARIHPDARSMLESINASLSRDMTGGMFVTLAWAEIEADRGRVRIARAGHNPPLILRSSGRVEQFQPGGIALGIDGGEVFQKSLEISDVQLERGDALILYTDGIVEAMNHDGVEYSLEAFARVLQNMSSATPDELVEGVLADLAVHVDGAEATDDITLVIARRE
ncbi:MAG: SpoIIE family protein phosphatase [Planctomycetota bacterium]|nr:SpoIIE family protein phosphatase [Planctomycetota bacterium]MDG2085666.1 SpoIIE family protein phosphatase [Planctomycetota bacterium]